MAQLLTCPQGHQWEREGASIPGSRVVCPVCGITAEALPLEQAGNGTQEAATLPPNPVPAWGAEAETLPHVAADGLAAAEAPTLPPPEQAPAPVTQERAGIPGYEILGELGRGGMGVVYKARQVQLDRLVALKMILSGSHAGEAELARFRTEGEAVARLQHPNIVQIHEVGEVDGRPFFSLEFCPGGSLDRQLDGTPLPPLKAAQLVETLARAMHTAHQAGIVHRDLKPANVLLAADGTPKVTDFGLAKRLESEPGVSTPGGLTVSGAIMGTPSYMAPEQAGGKSRGIGPAADIYALGAILYECLTGRPPFKAATPLETVLQVIGDDPVPPARLNPRVPRDLETICLKCLQKDPSKRYDSAEALVTDIARFLKGHPVHARPSTAWARGCKWAKRHPGVAISVAVIVAVAATGFGLTAWQWRRAKAALDDAVQAHTEATARADAEALARATAEDQRRRAKAAGRRAETHLYFSQVALAHHELLAGNVAGARQLLDETTPEFRGWEWDYLNGLCRGDVFSLGGHTGWLNAVVYSPDGRLLAVGGHDRMISLWDPNSGTRLRQIRGHDGDVRCLAFSPDGKSLVSASNDGYVRSWHVSTGQETRAVHDQAGAVTTVAFSPDGKCVVSAGADGVVRTRDPLSGQLLRSVKRHPGEIRSVAFSPRGRHLASAGIDGVIKIGDPTTGEDVLALHGHEGPVNCVAFSPDGTRLASASDDGTVRIWDWTAGKEELAYRGHQSIVLCVAYSPGGGWLASASFWDNTVRLWEARTGRDVLTLRGHRLRARSVAFSPVEHRLASASEDLTVKVWDTTFDPEACVFHASKGRCWGSACSPDGKWVASGGEYGSVSVWGVRTGKLVRTFQGHAGVVECVAFHPGSTLLVSAGEDQTLKLWDLTTGKRAAGFDGRGHFGSINGVAFSPDGRSIVSAGSDGTLRVRDAATGRPLRSIAAHRGPANGIAISRDGQRIASAGADRLIRVWDAATGAPLATARGHTHVVNRVAFSPDGKHLVSASWDATVRVWDAADGRELRNLRGHASWSVWSAVFSPDGRRIVSASDDRVVRLWDADTGHEILSLRGHTLPVYQAEFSPDGQRIVSSSWDGTLRVWDARRSTPGPAKGTRRFVPALHFQSAHMGKAQIFVMKPDASGASIADPAWSPDSKKIAFSSDRSGKSCMYVMDADGKHAKPLTYKQVRGRLPAWSPDGKKIAFCRQVDDTNAEIFVMDADGSNQTNLTNNPAYDADPAWSPDGKKIAFASNRSHSGFRLYGMDADGQNVKDISKTDNNQGFVYPAWSPDGKHIAYGERAKDSLELFVCDPDGGHKKQLTRSGATNSFAAWSPDGQEIAFLHFTGDNVGEAYVMDAEGGHLKWVAGPVEGGRPAWVPEK
jgi:WD40 repeat protein